MHFTTAFFTLSLHDALPIWLVVPHAVRLLIGAKHSLLLPLSIAGGALFLVIADTIARATSVDRKSTRLYSSHVAISYAVLCFKILIQTTILRWNMIYFSNTN